MGLFTITTVDIVNSPPSVIGLREIDLDYNELYTVLLTDFTINTVPPYQDPDGDPVLSVKVLTLPSVGVLSLNAVPVVISDEIDFSDINSGLLQYQADPGTETAHTDSGFTFDLSDTGSQLFSGLLDGQFIFNVREKVNLAPSGCQAITINLPYGISYPLTRADFTTLTTPAYSDPEGDPEEAIRIVSLPLTGVLVYAGSYVSVNQIITFDQIDTGYFHYTPDIYTLTAYSSSFNWDISDTGSSLFTNCF